VLGAVSVGAFAVTEAKNDTLVFVIVKAMKNVW